MSDQRDPRVDQGSPYDFPVAHPRDPAATYPRPTPSGPTGVRLRGLPVRPPAGALPSAARSAATRGATRPRPSPGAPSPRSWVPPQPPPDAGEIPLLTHDETGAQSMARAGGPAVAARSGPGGPPPGSGGSGGAEPPEDDGQGRSRTWRRIRRALYVLVGLLVLAPLLAFAVGWMLFRVPSVSDVAVTQVATFTYADAAQLATVRPDNVNRTSVPLGQVPTQVKQAVLAAEDRTFFSNPGFDITGIARAGWNQLTGRMPAC